MQKSQNGWPASPDQKEIGVKEFKIKNANRKMRLQKDAGKILAAFASEFHAQVEPIDEGVFDDWAYAYRNVRLSDSGASYSSEYTEYLKVAKNHQRIVLKGILEELIGA